MIDFSGKRVLVTGGSRGIGRAAVTEFLAGGARVAVNGRTQASTADGMAPHAERYGAAVVGAPGDVSTAAGCRGIVEGAAEALGGLDILVNSAGVGGSRPFEAIDEARWDEMIDINLKGTFFCTQAALPHLRAARGNVVCLASDAGLIGEIGLSAYCASKGGVVNLTRVLALELAPDVRVNCVCPGYVDTDMVRRDGIERSADPAAAERACAEYAPLGRMAEPWEIGKAIAYLASDAAGFVTGAALQIDGGSTSGRG